MFSEHNGQSPRSVFLFVCLFFSSIVFFQLLSTKRERLQQQRPHGEKVQHPASLFLSAPPFSCGALSALSASKFRISQFFRKALVISPLANSSLLCCFVVLASSRSVRTQRWRRSWCWPSPRTPSCMICMYDKNYHMRERKACLCICVCSRHAPTSSVICVHGSCDSGSISSLRSSSE